MTMIDSEQYLGLVKNSRLQLLLPESEARHDMRLTEMPMQVAIRPEVQEIAIKKHEGKAIMVLGRLSGDWIHSAEIIELASPIVTALVKKMFSI
jgi:hypothetical protein